MSFLTKIAAKILSDRERAELQKQRAKDIVKDAHQKKDGRFGFGPKGRSEDDVMKDIDRQWNDMAKKPASERAAQQWGVDSRLT